MKDPKLTPSLEFAVASHYTHGNFTFLLKPLIRQLVKLYFNLNLNFHFQIIDCDPYQNTITLKFYSF